ncbi:MAG: hypothetical protein ABI586_00660 [Candidatus Nanopelagicales bacterium]
MNGMSAALGRSSARHRVIRVMATRRGLPVAMAIPIALLITAVITWATATVVGRWT